MSAIFIVFQFMKNLFLFFSLCYFILLGGEKFIVGQNLVRNPGFESVDTNCLTTGAILGGHVPFWNSPTSGSPDEYSFCSQYTMVSVPFNYDGYQQPHNGYRYSGIWTYSPIVSTNGYWKEYVETKLDTSLVSQEHYCISFYLSLADSSGVMQKNIGIYFSDTNVFVNTFYNLFFTPQLNYSQYITDTANWTIVYFEYIAQGWERYMVIGNFDSVAATDTIQRSNYRHQNDYTYYYLDDVNIHCCTCDSTTSLHAGVGEEKKEEGLEVWPNPSEGGFTVSSTNKIKRIAVFDVFGENVYEKEIASESSATMDVGGLARGIYFLEVKTEQGIERRKFVKE